MTTEARETGSATGMIGWVGMIAGPLLAVLAWLLLPHAGAEGAAGLSDAGRATAAVVILMAVWWITEAIPLEATSLLPIVLFPLLGVSTVKAAAAPYASDVIFLFMGGLMLGLAMERWGLHRRIAMVVLGLVGTRPAMLVAGVLGATALMSMWVSNTAAAVMMLPIVLSIIGVVDGGTSDGMSGPGVTRAPSRSAFATASVLAIAYGASIGGVGTLIGTPPNAILAGNAAKWGLEPLSFTRWMWVGVPVVGLMLPVAWVVLTRIAQRVSMRPIPALRDAIARERAGLGRMSRGEWTVFGVFIGAVLCWVFREPMGRAGLGIVSTVFGRFSDAGVAIAAAVLLFLLPVHAGQRVFALDWSTAVRLPWGVLLLFGGGLSLAEAMTSTGVDLYVGSLFAHLGGMPPLLIVLIVAASILMLTEVASNTAIATTFLPIIHAAAGPMGLEPYALLIPTAMAASLAFMLPMGTPPNALVFASGQVSIRRMASTGLLMNTAAVIVITAVSYFLGPWLLSHG